MEARPPAAMARALSRGSRGTRLMLVCNAVSDLVPRTASVHRVCRNFADQRARGCHIAAAVRCCSTAAERRDRAAARCGNSADIQERRPDMRIRQRTDSHSTGSNTPIEQAIGKGKCTAFVPSVRPRPIASCRSGAPEQRWLLGQAASAGMPTMGSSLSGAMISSVM
jgi:hypothetical protein